MEGGKQPHSPHHIPLSLLSSCPHPFLRTQEEFCGGGAI